MNIITFLAFFIFGLNCWSISRRKATNKNHHYKDDLPEGQLACFNNVSKWCQAEYSNTKDIEVCKCYRFMSQCDKKNLCWDHLLKSQPELFI